MPLLSGSYPVSSAAKNTATLVSPAFVPEVGDIIVVKAATGDVNSMTLGTPTDSQGNTYTRWVVDATVNHCWVAIWTATASLNSSMTVSLAPAGSPINQWHSMVVNDWTFAALAATPAVNGTKHGLGSPASTITTTANASIVDWLNADWVPVDPSGHSYDTTSSLVYEDDLESTADYTVYYAHQDATSASSQTLGLTAPGGQTWSLVGVEILDAGAPVTEPDPGWYGAMLSPFGLGIPDFIGPLDAGDNTPVIPASQTLVEDTSRATGSGTTTASVTTTAAADTLIVAFVTWDSSVSTSLTGSMAGGSLTWALQKRQNASNISTGGGTEIWTAYTVAGITSQSLTITVTSASACNLTIVTFANADPVQNGKAVGQDLTAAGLFTSTYQNTRDQSWPWAVMYNFDTGTSGTAPAGQTIVRTYLDGAGDAGWVQKVDAKTASIGTVVVANDTAPSVHGHMCLLEILPAYVAPGAPSTNAPADVAPATASALDATITITANADFAAAAATANNATAKVSPNAGLASASATANNATTTAAPNAGNAAAAAVANQPAAKVAPNAGLASATAAAFNPTVTTSAGTNAPAGLASASATAFDATVKISPNAGLATATATANNVAASVGVQAGLASAAASSPASSARIAPNAGLASATAAAQAPTVNIGAAAGLASAAASSSASSIRINVNAGLATATAAAFDATVSTASQTSAPAGLASAAAVANAPTVKVQANAGLATAAAAANAPTPNVRPNAGLASAAGSANNATVTTAKLAPAGLASAVSTANQPTITVRVNADAAIATAQAFGATIPAGLVNGTSTPLVAGRFTSVPAVAANRTSTAATVAPNSSTPAVAERRTSSPLVGASRTSTPAVSDG